jgi:hypothetical protein
MTRRTDSDQIRQHARDAARAAAAERPLTVEVALAVARVLRG